MSQKPYSLFRKIDGIVVTSGALGLFPDQHGASLVEGGVLEQLKAALKNAELILKDAGCTRHDVFKANLYLTSLEKLAEVNEIWIDFFNEPRPVRTTVAVVELPRKALVELDLWANVNPRK
jgi:2-iminobutanoate/2-iminopropanoate deaminase